MSGGAALQPTFQGHVATTQDALILFEACLQGHLSHVPRRPHDRERSSLIRSGSVFIYEENASGIKRWTDGVTWSPSRILGNFLVYRELDKPFPPGEKKRAMKKQQRRPSRPGEPYPKMNGGAYSDGQPSAYGERTPSAEVERQLIGSLVDSYGFKPDGLVKKTMSVTVQGVTHHLVSYYNVNDVMANQLRSPSHTENLQYIRPRAELMTKQSFRSPIEDVDDVEGQHNLYGYRVNSGYMPEYNKPQQSTQQQQYYMNYPPMPQSQPPYSMGVPAMPAPYMPSPVSTPHLQGGRNDYSQYDQSAYNRSYDSLNNSLPPAPKPIPSAPPTTMPSMGSERSQSQSGMYPPMNMQRPINNLSPVSMDSRNSVSYRSSYPSTANTGPMDHARPPEPSPTQVKYEDRRDSGQQQQSQLYQSPRAPYYGDGGAQSMPPSQYPPQPPLGQWPGQSHGSN